ncbi:MAG: DMT family transporter [Coriobacteriales bacterium]|nr:DMT family transporter [Coriobacteriales bacterium]
MNKNLTIGILYTVIGAVCWGFSATAVSYLTNTANANVIWLASFRMIICGSIFMVIALAKDRHFLKKVIKSKKEIALVLINAIIGIILMQISYMSCIAELGAGSALLLMEAGLVIIVVINCIFHKRKPTVQEIIALILTFLGVFSIASQGNIGSLGISPIGFMWGMLSAIALAGNNVAPAPLLKKYGSPAVNGMSMLLAAVLIIPFGRPWDIQMNITPQSLFMLASVIVFGTFCAYLFYMNGVKKIGPVKASLIGLLEPVSAIAFSFFLIGKSLTLWDGIGAVFILTMMIIIALPSKEDKEQATDN